MGLPSCPLVEYQTAMDSTLSGRMSNERFSATSKDVVKSETALMVLFTAENRYIPMWKIIHGFIYACQYLYSNHVARYYVKRIFRIGWLTYVALTFR